MALEDQYPVNTSVASGSTIFPFQFKVLRQQDLVVEVDKIEKTYEQDYTLTGVGDDAGGEVEFLVAPEDGKQVVIFRDMKNERETNYSYQGEFREAVVDRDFDRIYMILQQLTREFSRSLKLPMGESTELFSSYSTEQRAGTVIGFDDDGLPTLLSDLPDSVISSSPVAGAAIPWGAQVYRVMYLSFLKLVTGGPMLGSVYVEARDSIGDGYAGVFTWLSGDQSENPFVLLDNEEGVYVKPSYPGDGSLGVWKRRYQNEIDVRWFGAVCDGVTDDRNALQVAINVTGKGILTIPVTEDESLYISDYVVPNDGMTIKGSSKEYSSIKSPAGTVTFKWQPAGAGGRAGFYIRDLEIQSDYPIKINDTAVTLVNGSGDSPFIGGGFERVRLVPITGGGVGTAFEASKMFDTYFRDSIIGGGYSISMILNGCDINKIDNNRITDFVNYGIICVSGGSFGSQNEITNNDMVCGTNKNAIFIKSTDRHVNIHDNYLEQQGSVGTGIFIDISTTDSPAYGANVQTNSYTIKCRDNRLDGQHLVQYVHRVNPSAARTIVVEEKNQPSINLGTSIFDTDNNDIPINFEGYNTTNVSLSCSSWGKVWDGFRTENGPYGLGDRFKVDARHFDCFLPLNSTAALRAYGNRIIMPTSMVAANIARITPDGNENLYFPESATITVTVLARTDSASGDSIKIAKMSSSGNTFSSALAIDSQFRYYTFSFTGPAQTDTSTGIGLTRETQNGKIEIAAVSWSF